MNPPPDLQVLMTLDALGEATPQQRTDLEERLAAHPELSRQNVAARDLVARMEDTVSPLPPPVAVPASALVRMETARTAALARSAGAVNVVSLTGASSSASAGKTAPMTKVRRSRGITRMLAWAAVFTLLAAPVGWWLSHRQETTLATASPALAPRGETGMTQPTLVWENAPQQDYDVWILPEGADQKTAPALFVASKVRSPLPFASLQPGPANEQRTTALNPGTPYLALVCLSGRGRLAGVTVAFKTSPAALGAPPVPSDAATALALIQHLETSGRTSDALMVVASLPPAVASHPEIVAMAGRLRARLNQAQPR